MHYKKNYNMIKLKFCVFLIIIFINVFICDNVLGIWSIDTNNISNEKRVLILDSNNNGYKWSKDILTTLILTLKKSKITPNINIEYLDSENYNDKDYYEAMSKLLIEKYKSKTIDVVVVIDQQAFQFINEYGDEMLGDIPVIFCGVETINKAELENKKISGILEFYNLEKNIELMLNLSPDIEKIVVVTDELFTENETFKKLLDIEKQIHNIRVENIISSDTEYIKDKINNIKEEKAVLLMRLYPQNYQKFNSDIHVAKWLSDNIDCPIYTPIGSYIGSGVIGGNMTFGYKHGQHVGEILVKVLNGFPIEDIPIIEDRDTVLRFDYKYMDKYKIDQNKLPKGSIIANKPSNQYKMDKDKAIGLVMLIIFIIFLISTYLIINVKKRKIAEMSEELNKKRLLEIQEFDNMRADFFANISHELRTPINVILSAIQYLELKIQKEPVDNVFIRYFKNIKNNSYRLPKLINNLIDITKLDSGYLQLDIKNYEIVSVVEDITLSVADFIESKKISLIFDTEIEEKIVACDADMIERMVLNLLSNAAKFTDEGGKIFVNMTEDKEYVNISVKDTGIGIPKEKLEIIFSRFGQVESSIERNKDGSGIGLSLVENLVKKHNGKIIVKSEEGKGTEFIISIPSLVLENEDIVILSDTQMNGYQKINIEFSDF